MIEVALLGSAAALVYKACQRIPSGPRGRSWELPALSVLDPPARPLGGDLAALGAALVAGLSARDLDVSLVDVVTGPTVARFELDLGTSRVAALSKLRLDIGVLLGSPNPRLLTPIPGKHLVGVEIERPTRDLVNLRSVLGSEVPRVLEIAIGVTSDGDPLLANLKGLPHLLIAGATGAGKSTFLNSLIVSLLMGASPDDLQLLLIDPKRVELTQYSGLPHLRRPIVTEGGDAIGALGAVVNEMNARNERMRRMRVRNLSEARAKGWKVPYLVVIIDEVAELMMTAKEWVEPPIARIAQLGRAAGMHLVVATQRPDVKVITGGIKANIPGRVGFAVASHVDSKVILDKVGAETLYGKGDMLFARNGLTLTRAQAALVTDDEIRKVVQWWTKQR